MPERTVLPGLADYGPEARYAARLEDEVARVREESRRAVERFKAGFAPPNESQIERLLYPELSEFSVELGGRTFTVRELPALAEKKFLRLAEQKLPALMKELLSFDERLGDDPQTAFARLLARAGTAMDLVAEACVLVLDADGSHEATREFVQEHASTARQLRILQAQLLINGGRDFLSQLFRGPEDRTLGPSRKSGMAEGPGQDPTLNGRGTGQGTSLRSPVAGAECGAGKPDPAAEAATPASPRLSVGLNSCAIPLEPSPANSPLDNWL